jgi:glycosyltransferase involved in cell wall biosynthesis
MHVLLVNYARIPVFAYGGTERVIWDLAWGLTQLGHQVTFLAPEGSHCDFAKVLVFDTERPLKEQIPKNVDIVHFQFQPDFDLDSDFDLPYLMTEHGNYNRKPFRPLNTVFVSRDHAARHNSKEFIYNGLNWDAYGPVDFSAARKNFHFLGKAEWSVKNVKGAIEVAKKAKVTLDVLGGDRFNFRRGFRMTFSRRIIFHGMVGGEEKFRLLNGSQGLIFPTRWHEPFGLCMIESLYFGCPVFGTTYGALPELITGDVGLLANSAKELALAVREKQFDPKVCHELARDTYNALAMVRGYVAAYERILNGEKLNATPPFLTNKSRKMLPW